MLPIVCYTHSDYEDVFRVQSAFLDSYTCPKYIMRNAPLDGHNVLLYEDTLKYSKRVLQCLQQLDDEYILFVRDMDILVLYFPSEAEQLVEFMKEHVIDCVDLQRSNEGLQNPISFGHLTLTKPHQWIFNLNPCIWKRSALMEIMSRFDHTYRDIEGGDVQHYVSKFNIYRLWSPACIHAGYFYTTDWFIYIHITTHGQLMTRTNNNLDPWLQSIYTDILERFHFDRPIRTQMYGH